MSDLTPERVKPWFRINIFITCKLVVGQNFEQGDFHKYLCYRVFVVNVRHVQANNVLVIGWHNSGCRSYFCAEGGCTGKRALDQRG